MFISIFVVFHNWKKNPQQLKTNLGVSLIFLNSREKKIILNSCREEVITFADLRARTKKGSQ